MRTPDLDWLALSPTLWLLGASCVALLAAVFLPRGTRRAGGAVVCGAGFAGALALAAILYVDADAARTVVADTFARDRFAALAALIVCGTGLLTVLLAWNERLGRGEFGGEFFSLLAAAGAGMVFIVGANDLMTIFLGLEWFSISLYVLCAVGGDRLPSLEASLKYLVVGSFGSAVLLFGFALVYGATGELELTAIGQALGEGEAMGLAGLAFVLAGFAFKASAAPFHMWTPDVYEGAPTSVTAFMSAATKTVALAVALRVLVTAFPEQTELWTAAAAALAVASLAIGNLAALVQRGVKRMLAYSSVSHAGFMLIGVVAASELGGRALLYYLIPYSAMSVGAFAVVAARERELGREVTIDDLRGMLWERPLLGVSMWTFMIGFAGLPLTGGFIGKFYVFSAAHEAGWTWLVIVGVAATAVSLYYYLRVVLALWTTPELRVAPVGGSPPREAALQTAVAACLAVTVGSFFAVQPLIDLAQRAADQLPF
ncbi:MAG TPA: NADH-quinone oxidoreductase subunit N [Gaiellaceae bacterium]|nr:NADH-quinone oxidoreductase subunit N [Gaiellaceae bacterium]